MDCMVDHNIVNIFPLQTWGGVASPTPYRYTDRPWHIFYLNTSSRPCSSPQECSATVRWLQDYKIVVQEKSDIRYNFTIGGDGNVYEGRGWEEKPLLPVKYQAVNRVAVLIAFIGKYTEENLPRNMSRTAARLVTFGAMNGYIQKRFKSHNIFKKPGLPNPYVHYSDLR